MADYISREAVVKYLEYCSGGYDYIETEKKGAINYIKAIPAADVRPVKIGHYITDDMGDSSCSECGEKYLDITKRFCQECGAELRRNEK